MKSKKFLFPALVFIIAIVAMVIFCIVTNIAMKPTITQQDFPFSITYELDGETNTIEGVYSVSFVGNDGYVDATGRIYEDKVITQQEGMDTALVLCENDKYSVTLHTNFYPDYLMGDPDSDYFTYREYAPILTATDWNTYEEAEGLELEKYGARILSWEYPEPIVNSLVFSHIAHPSGEVVIPLLAIAAAVLLLILIFVRKEKDLPKKRINTIGVIFNFVIALTVLPFATLFGFWSDIVGSSGELLHQLGYYIPAIIVLGLAASVCLRRKGYRKSSFAMQFVGPVVFALLILLLMAQELS